MDDLLEEAYRLILLRGNLHNAEYEKQCQDWIRRAALQQLSDIGQSMSTWVKKEEPLKGSKWKIKACWPSSEGQKAAVESWEIEGFYTIFTLDDLEEVVESMQ